MRINFLSSLMSFNERVLTQGYIDPYGDYTMKDLKDALFFNSVFHSNCDEIFMKYHLSPELINQYIRLHKIYIQNMAAITRQLLIVNPSINLSTTNTFERRWNTYLRIKDRIKTDVYNPKNGIRYPFEQDKIYYICWDSNNQYLLIHSIDNSSSVYETPFVCESLDKVTYWKTDACIRDYLSLEYHEELGHAIACKVTMSNDDLQVIRKVEYNGNLELMQKLTGIFGYKALIISNAALYTDDIKQMIDLHTPKDEVPILRQRNQKVDLMSYTEKDALVEYPMDSFDEYLQFLSNAANSSDVEEIRLTLYRIGDNPAIFYILRKAVSNGIAVHVNIELCATGESINRLWMREMEEAGIVVTNYGAGKIKVHSKLTIIRFTNNMMIAQIGTGNYHTKTTSQYTDLSLITGNQDICKQIWNLFQSFLKPKALEFNENFLVTQYNALDTLTDLIDQEAAKGMDGFICFKCNALDDEIIIEHLNKAAATGCEIELIVRGVCTWLPKQLEENVNIRSFIWDKLEHSRVYSFGRDNPIIYLGSLDLVSKKINQRIETLVRVLDPEITIKICDYLNRYITSHDAWHLSKDGEYWKE